MSHFLFSSESVAIGHPDKIADQISDAIVDACLSQDPFAKVACEAVVSTGLVFLAGEITTHAVVDYAEIARQTVKEIGYCDGELGFDYRSFSVLQCINKQSPDIAQGVDEGRGLDKRLGAGDQGMMFGYACRETPELMPLPIQLAHQIVRKLNQLRKEGIYSYLRPDAKTQITIEYTKDYQPVRIHTVVLSTQTDDQVDFATIEKDMRVVVKSLAPKGMIDDETLFYINPTGRFVLGGPGADCGLTGRKITVDTYGGMAHHGGGAFSGKDPTKVDRSASYAARYVAKNIVAANIASRCEVQLAYAIGLSHPVSLFVNTFGTAKISDQIICEVIPKIFDLSPKGIIEMLDLRRPIYRQTAWGGHFGREEKDFTWEQTNKIDNLLDYLS